MYLVFYPILSYPILSIYFPTSIFSITLVQQGTIIVVLQHSRSHAPDLDLSKLAFPLRHRDYILSDDG